LARVVLSGEVRNYTGVDADSEIELEAKNVMQLFRKLGELYPMLKPVLEEGFAVAIDGELYEDALLQPIGPGSEVILVPRIAGG
jgi:molybdopterin converting factor small subunit